MTRPECIETYSLWFDDGVGEPFERSGMSGRQVSAQLRGLAERIKDGERIQFHLDPETPAAGQSQGGPDA